MTLVSPANQPHEAVIARERQKPLMCKEVVHNEIQYSVDRDACADSESWITKRVAGTQYDEHYRRKSKDCREDVVELKYAMMGLVVRAMDVPKQPMEQISMHHIREQLHPHKTNDDVKCDCHTRI